MLVLLSPAKDLDLTSEPPHAGATQPRFQQESAQLIDSLRTLSVRKLSKLMTVSPKLAELNHRRYAEWTLPFTAKNARPAVFTFNGEVYRGLAAVTLSAADLRCAQRHVRILSGLHGVLRPLDLMRPYRLEMGTGLRVDRKHKDLYAFWGERITQAVNDDLAATEDDVVVNLASTEYFRSIRTALLKARVITPIFKESGPGGPRVVTLFAKQQRGRMCRWLVKNRMAGPEAIKGYDQDGYGFDQALSTTDEWVFTRPGR